MMFQIYFSVNVTYLCSEHVSYIFEWSLWLLHPKNVSYILDGTYPNVSSIFLGPPTKKGVAARMYHCIFELPKDIVEQKQMLSLHFEVGGYSMQVTFRVSPPFNLVGMSDQNIDHKLNDREPRQVVVATVGCG